MPIALILGVSKYWRSIAANLCCPILVIMVNYNMLMRMMIMIMIWQLIMITMIMPNNFSMIIIG